MRNCITLSQISKYGLLFCFYCFISVASAQEADALKADINVIPPSPTVMEIQKYVDVPVNLYTGTPDISIPLYTLKTPQLELPIVLKYHASGLKVEEEASWVGAGWTLQAGGVVSRTIRGLPDEFVNTTKKGWFRTKHLFLSNGNPDIAYIEGCTETGSGVPDGPTNAVDSLAMGHLDSEPDFYHFTLANGSGKFLFDQDANLVRYNKDDIDFIEHPFQGSLPVGALNESFEWKIRGEDGVVYQFTDKETTNTFSGCGSQLDPFDDGTQQYQNAWYMSNMALSGDSIKFLYDSESYSRGFRHVESYKYKISGNGDTSISDDCYNNNDIYGQRLSRIQTSNGYEVIFHATVNRQDLSGTKRLEKVEVQKNGVKIKEWKFSYGYFGSNTKLKLNSVAEVNLTNATDERTYDFDYFQGAIPAIDSRKQDFWGYYNGASGNNFSMIPSYKSGYYHVNQQSTVSRAPDLVHTRYGTLQKITYPTGGYSKFEYGLHDYYDANYVNELVMTASATPSNTSMQFDFTLASQSYATITTDNAANTFDDWTKLLKKNGNGVYVSHSPAGSPGQRATLPAGDYRIVANSQLYSKFIKVEYEEVGINNRAIAGGLRIQKIQQYDGRTFIDKHYKYVMDFKEQSFSVLAANEVSSGKLFSPPILGGHTTTITKQQPGLCSLISQSDYIALNAYTQLPLTTVQGSHIGYSTVHEYRVSQIGQTQTKVLGQSTFKFINDTPSGATAFPYVPQQDMSHRNGKPLEELVYKYVTGGTDLVLQSKKVYTYDSPILYTSEQVKGLNYKFDVSSTCYVCRQGVYRTHTITPVWHRLQSIDEYDYSGGGDFHKQTTYAYNQTLHHKYISYQYTDSKSDVVDVEVTRLTSAPALTTKVERFVDSQQVAGQAVTYHGKLQATFSEWNATLIQTPISHYEYDLKYTKTFENNRVVELTEFSGSEALKTSYLWSYHASYPVAEIKNKAYTDIASSFKTTLLNTASELVMDGQFTSLRSTYPDNHITTMLYKNGVGLKEVQDPNNIQTTYGYDGFNHLVHIKDNNGKFLQEFEYNYGSN